jgi:hypothetical protein
MKRLALALLLSTLAGVAVAPAVASASLCVGTKPGCYSTLAAAVAAAHDGDTIKIAKGTYGGGVTIDKSVSLVGAGAGKTTISGSGPVLTIGTFHAASEPTVSLQGLTITGGDTTSSFGTAGSRAVGGGIQIPPNAACQGGATVTISDSVISGNTAQPSATGTDASPCPGSPTHFALAGGGGIYNAGRLTLRNTMVSGNTAGGGVTSNAWGGGILSGPSSTVTIRNSVISDNRVTVSDPNGVQATGGGILMQGDPLIVSDSTISGNQAVVTSSLVGIVDGFQANSAGIQCDHSMTVVNTQIVGNLVSATAPNGEPAAFDAGFDCGSGTLRDSTVSGNQVIANVGDTTDSGPDGGAAEFDGPFTITNTRFTGNTFSVTTVNGLASAVGAVSAFDGDPTSPGVIRNSVISNNTMTATSTNGSATVQGGGIANNGALELRNDRISHNNGTAHGADGFAQGGGIWNGELFGASPTSLTLDHTTVDRNTLDADPGISAQGGGLYTVGFGVTLTHSTIHHNTPDNCAGC